MVFGFFFLLVMRPIAPLLRLLRHFGPTLARAYQLLFDHGHSLDCLMRTLGLDPCSHRLLAPLVKNQKTLQESVFINGSMIRTFFYHQHLMSITAVITRHGLIVLAPLPA
jgi:hypothetical protein